MHYILNTTFTVPDGVNVRPRIGGPTIVSSQINENSNINIPTKFQKGVTYVLTNIKKVDDGIEYLFRSLHDNSVVSHVFVDCKEADILIANIKKERLPNYQEFYEKLKV